MKHIYEGKTKSVYQLENGTILLKFKDDVTCSNGVFDPGANSTGIKIDGAGLAGLKMSAYFFELLKKCGIPTHFISANLEEHTMNVLPVSLFGKGLEVVCRKKATGSFMRRYGDYATEGQDLNYFVEMTLKDDKREDPVISEDALDVLGIMSKNEYEAVKELTQKITKIVSDDLEKIGLTLYDIKFEFGKTKDGVILIDEISGGNMRVYQGNRILLPLELSELVLKA